LSRILSATTQASYLRVANVPRGPTITMKINNYTLTRDIANSASNYSAPPGIFQTPPLVVLNNFTEGKHMRLAAVVFQNLFPAINVKTVKLATCKRIVLLDFESDTEVVHFRHYYITAQVTPRHVQYPPIFASPFIRVPFVS
jgi:ribosome biogenesis protein SSF1/2